MLHLGQSSHDTNSVMGPPAAVFIKNFDSRGLHFLLSCVPESARCSSQSDTLSKARIHLRLGALRATGPMLTFAACLFHMLLHGIPCTRLADVIWGSQCYPLSIACLARYVPAGQDGQSRHVSCVVGSLKRGAFKPRC
jgi:hypothetical protein